jgi:hypothetical protein
MWPSSALTNGSRVRVRLSTAANERVAGTLAALEGQVLTLNTEGGPLKITVRSGDSVELGLGRKRQWLQGMGIGAAAGLGAGFLYPVDSSDCDMDSPNFCSRGQAVGGATLVYGLIGAGVGAFVRRERWVPVDTSNVAQLTITESAQQPLAGGASSSARRSWSRRHPVLFGTLAGTGLGAVVGATTFPEDHNPDVTKGMYVGYMSGTLGAM